MYAKLKEKKGKKIQIYSNLKLILNEIFRFFQIHSVLVKHPEIIPSGTDFLMHLVPSGQ